MITPQPKKNIWGDTGIVKHSYKKYSAANNKDI